MPNPPVLLERVPLSPLLRGLVSAFAVLTLLAFVALLVGAEHTDEAFAWTIAPPLASAFLGAGYGAGCLLVVLILRSGTWEQARWVLSSVLLFVILTSIATFMHLDRLHLSGTTGVATSAAWFWLAIYIVLPPVMALGLLREERGHRHSRVLGPSQTGATTGQPRLFTQFLVGQGVLLGVAGLALFVVASPLVDRWPWALTPFVSRVTGAWLLAFALAAFLAARAHVSVLVPSTLGYATFGALELLAVVLHSNDLRSGAATILYVVVAMWIVLTGAWGSWLAMVPRPSAAHR